MKELENFCIVTGYDRAYEEMGRHSAASLIRYAALNRIHWRVTCEFTSGRPVAWEKIRIILDLFREGCEYVCWLDADAAFMRFDVDIRDEVPLDKDLAWVEADVEEVRQPASQSFSVIQPCSGFMVLRNTLWTREFLQEVWARTEFLNHCWWDLAAFINVCGYDRAYDSHMRDRGKRELLALADPAKAPRPRDEIRAHIGRLDGKWNLTDQSDRTAGARPVVRHFTGSNGPFARRLFLMRAWLGVE